MKSRGRERALESSNRSDAYVDVRRVPVTSGSQQREHHHHNQLHSYLLNHALPTPTLSCRNNRTTKQPRPRHPKSKHAIPTRPLWPSSTTKHRPCVCNQDNAFVYMFTLDGKHVNISTAVKKGKKKSLMLTMAHIPNPTIHTLSAHYNCQTFFIPPHPPHLSPRNLCKL